MSQRQTILVVDDDEDLRRLFRTSLALAGYDVVEAGAGPDALQRIEEAPPDLVVLDLMLPGFSGVIVRQELASHILTRHIPIVVITGSPLLPEGLDVNCIIRKPATTDQLIATVRRCLGAPAGDVV